MAITEIFQRPTVKQVIFQIRYPNLFFLESKIGDLQIKIMDLFDDSALLLRKQVVFADLGPNSKMEDLLDEKQMEQGKKIWQFTSIKGYQLNVLNDSLDITSQLHKTYNNKDSDIKFRDIIQTILTHFFALTKIPLISRVGLRYIDECPMPESNFLDYFNTSFPINRFKVEDAQEMMFKTTVKRGDYMLRYAESMQPPSKENIGEDKNKLILDFDGCANNVKADQCMETTDALHEMISAEFENTIKEPMFKYMRGELDI